MTGFDPTRPGRAPTWPKGRGGVTGALLGLPLLLLLASCNGVFFQPDSYLYYQPRQLGLWHEEVEFKSADGTRLAGWFLPGKKPVKGTVVHFHGNAANISNHLLAVRWLPEQGYSVFLFDYRGYGISRGSPRRSGAIEDGAAAINYVRGRKDVDPQRLFVYGQSLGGALAFNALAQAGAQGVQGLVVEGAFRSYREMVRLIMNKTWVLWLFQYPVSYLLFTDSNAPEDVLEQLKEVPLLVVHGEKDNTVPIEAGKRLFQAFPGRNKAFWPIPNADHQMIFTPKGSPWRENLVQYFQQRLGDAEQKRQAQRHAETLRRRPMRNCEWAVEKLKGKPEEGFLRCDEPGTRRRAAARKR